VSAGERRIAFVSRPWFIVGCGYTGTHLARSLVGRGEDVAITRRDPEALEQLAGQLGARGVRVDLAEPSTLRGVIAAGSIVVCLAPPGADPAGELGALIDAARDASRFVYVSSTGVYAPGGGAEVDESWPIEPTTASGRARAAAESALSRAQVPWIALRVAGIHGPGRGLMDRIRDGTYRVIGDGSSHVSRIHVVDLVAVITAAGLGDTAGFVNVADDDPAPIGMVADAVASHLGVAPPPRVPVADVSPELAGMLTADRRISNARMKRELGVVLRYPSWRDALVPGALQKLRPL
jgi:nucleoside-diphosphate-sugar epimerase